MDPEPDDDEDFSEPEPATVAALALNLVPGNFYSPSWCDELYLSVKAVHGDGSADVVMAASGCKYTIPAERTAELVPAKGDVPPTPHAVRISKFAFAKDRAKIMFKDHVLEVVQDNGMYRHYVCAKPGTFVYRFSVVTWPGWLVVTGDLGSVMLSRTEDMIGWARDAVGSPDYFFEKVPRNIEVESFDEELAKAVVAEVFHEKVGYLAYDVAKYRPGEKEFDERLDKLVETKADLDRAAEEGGTSHFIHAAYYDTNWWDGCDTPTVEIYDPCYIFILEGVKWLLKRLPKEKPTATDPVASSGAAGAASPSPTPTT